MLELLLTFYEFNKQEINKYLEELVKFELYISKTFQEENDAFNFSDISDHENGAHPVDQRILEHQKVYKKALYQKEDSICKIIRFNKQRSSEKNLHE